MNHVTSPRTDDAGIEQEIIAKGLTAPRVTPADLEANIASEHYFTAENGIDGAVVAAIRKVNPATQISLGPLDRDYDVAATPVAPLTLLTFCVLILRNGFTVTGESACASPENFDAELGRKIALENAKQKIWPLMGYALKSQLTTV